MTRMESFVLNLSPPIPVLVRPVNGTLIDTVYNLLIDPYVMLFLILEGKARPWLVGPKEAEII